MRFMWEKKKISLSLSLVQLMISIQWKLMNSLPIYSIGGQHESRRIEQWKEEVIYFNQTLPTSNPISIKNKLFSYNFFAFSRLFKIKLKSEKEREMKQMVIALICIIIVPLIYFFILFLKKYTQEEINEISSSFERLVEELLLLFIWLDSDDPRGDNLYVNFIVLCVFPQHAMLKKELMRKMKKF